MAEVQSMIWDLSLARDLFFLELEAESDCLKAIRGVHRSGLGGKNTQTNQTELGRVFDFFYPQSEPTQPEHFWVGSGRVFR